MQGKAAWRHALLALAGLATLAVNVLIYRQLLVEGVARLPFAMLCSALTAIPPIGVMLALDHYEIEPLGHMVLVFYCGASIAPGFTLLIGPKTFFAGALAEEGAKALLVLGVCHFFAHEVDEPVDALIYSFLVAIGFGFTENNIHFTNHPGFHGDLAVLVSLLAVRFAAMIGHLTFTGLFGTGLAIRLETGSKVSIPLSFAAGVGLHYLWNSTPLAGGPAFLLRFLPFVLLVFFVARRFHRHESALIREYGSYYPIIQEFVEGQQEEFPDRARRFEVLGDVMVRPWSLECRARYQHFQAVSKLAFLRWNMRRGLGPAGEAAQQREQVLVARIQSTYLKLKDCRKDET
ncbi:MAG TPA: PrsW family glutamic-type intramembrane protease [Bryobacteraceae bacterium]|nr:PrsW family glutamic-type intramembrane protease [Bryobacteraceae bacterium]